MKMGGVATVSVLATAVAANRGLLPNNQKAHASWKKAVGVATNTRVFMKVPHDLFQVTTVDENGRGSHGERLGDNCRRELWASS